MAQMADKRSRETIFHRTIDLQIGVGCETLRHLLHYKLDGMKLSLKEYLDRKNVRSTLGRLHPRFLTTENFNLLYPSPNDPNDQQFDYSLLTLLLLNGDFRLTNDEKSKVRKLRGLRNGISHVPRPELADETIFTEAGNSILDLATLCGKDVEKHIKGKICELERKELVSVRSNIEMVKLRNESLMVKLVETKDDAKTDACNTTLLHYGLTKWAKRFTEDVHLDSLMIELKREGVLSYMEKDGIEKHYNKAEQCNALILKIVEETDANLWKFLRCLRANNRNLADLIENKADDGADIELKLRTEQEGAIKSAMLTVFEVDDNEKVVSEDVHIVVEEKLGYSVPFARVEKAVADEFGLNLTSDSWFIGMKWKQNRNEALETMSCILPQTEVEQRQDDIGYVGCTCEEFGDKVASLIDNVKEGYGPLIREAIIEECISPKTFSKLDEPKMKDWLTEYMQGKKLLLGITEELREIRGNILDELNTSQRSKDSISTSLRAFDTTGEHTQYRFNEKVNPPIGNLLTPVHEFRTLIGIDTSPKVYIVKECVRFVCACINTRKNGTIHFGIEPVELGLGRIQGIQLSNTAGNVELDLCVESGIEACFETHILINIKRCLRPFQTVLLDNNNVVLEMDVVPSTLCTDDGFCTIKFPPKGMQTESTFVYTADLRPELMVVPVNKVEETRRLYADNLKGRKLLENRVTGHKSDLNKHEHALRKRVTADSKYITDQYFPVIFCGKATGADNERDVRESFDSYMADLFKSAAVIFDFDTSPKTRQIIEETTADLYQVRTTDGDDISFEDGTETYWIYSNGNSDIPLGEMDTNDWLLHRSRVIKQILGKIRLKIPDQRALLIFFFFESEINRDSPMASIAEECMVSSFRNECVVIASSSEAVAELRTNVFRRKTESENFEQHFHTVLSWKEISSTLMSVSRSSSFNTIKLPCKDGGRIAVLKTKHLEKMKITDIDIVSGVQCTDIDDMDKESQKCKMLEEKERFYRGEEVSWWNFHFMNQVGERDLYPRLQKSIKSKLASDGLVETETLLHQPGAGGTTAGRYILWNLSQFRPCGPEGAFRCCVVKQITEHTAGQICEFMSYEDQNPKSVVVLIDNLSEESIVLLRDSLYEKAYKRHLANSNVFCVLIVVRRVMISYEDKATDHILKHHLSQREQIWFEEKYKELEDNDEIDVNTLISFNVMRNSFDIKYIQDLVKQFLQGVQEVEIPILKCLALINMFDRDSVIPLTIFDYLISGRQTKSGTLLLSSLLNKGPIGLVVPFRDRRVGRSPDSPWNTRVTEAFSLLTKRICSKTSKTEIGPEYPGVMMISYELAREVLWHIIEKEESSLAKTIQFVLQIVKEHMTETNPMSKEFVKIVNSLFKTRQILQDDLRAKFSEMVMHLIETEDTNTVVIDLMRECFETTKDAMVGQQLARFYIYMKDYVNAEKVIAEAIEIQPKSSYLLDTYGQVFYSQMEHLLEAKSSKMGKIPDNDAADIIKIAFSALEKFKAGQTITSEKEDEDNTSCYSSEVKTILFLLENFSKFSCHLEEKDFLHFLNNTEAELPKSYSQLNSHYDLVELTRTSVTITHVDESLRLLEERHYQLKRRLYTVHAGKDEKLLLKLRERFERYYGSAGVRESFKFKFGVGLKSLMIASKTDRTSFQSRVDEAVLKLHESEKKTSLNTVDKRDLLVILGKTIIEMSSKGAEVNPAERPMEREKYNDLLRYAERLLDLEGKSKRPYLEAALYYTMLNWPSDSRQDIENLGKPEKLKHVLQDWKTSFDQNFKTEARRKSPYPKTYFALGRGSLGCDIVDFDLIEKKWRKSTGKKRQYVQDDHVWEKSYVQNTIKRLEGTLNDKGTFIWFESKLQYWTYQFNIACQQPNKHLCNRKVSFILVFTWAGPMATDIRNITAKTTTDDDGPSSLEKMDDDENDQEKGRMVKKGKKGGSAKHKNAKTTTDDDGPSSLEKMDDDENDQEKWQMVQKGKKGGSAKHKNAPGKSKKRAN